MSWSTSFCRAVLFSLNKQSYVLVPNAVVALPFAHNVSKNCIVSLRTISPYTEKVVKSQDTKVTGLRSRQTGPARAGPDTLQVYNYIQRKIL